MKKILAALLSLVLITTTSSAVKGQDSAAPQEGQTPFKKLDVEFSRDGKKISAVLFLPESETPVPAIILSHGFGGNKTPFEWGYGPNMARYGVAACAFDFCGGGRDSKSDGKTSEMSVLTEAADLSAVLDAILKRPEIDPQNVFLLGESQGGFVSSYVAASRPNDVRGLVAVFPAYVIQDDARKRTPNLDDAPETMNVMGMTLGKIYNADALSFDIYEMLPNYDRNVLIMHGTADTLVPMTYSRFAEKVFPHATLVPFPGAGHGFGGDDAIRAFNLALKFVQENIVKNESGAEN